MTKRELNQILTTMLKSHHGVSDLNFTVGRPPQVEAFGQLLPVEFEIPIPALTPYQTETLALLLIDRDWRLTEVLIREGSCDLSYALEGLARFRVNIFSQRGCYSIVLRKLEARVPTIEDLSLPPVFHRMAEEKNGLILVTGATGSGKSTSLAALLNVINLQKSVHVITLEDPVEFIHPHQKATFNQRELGVDFDQFAHGLRAALRQAPKVILVGEMRDRETVEIGLSAAETGHLVLSTLHTIDAGQTVSRILGMFEREEEKQIRIRLSETIRWIVCQRLLPGVEGGRVAAFEIMGSNLRIQEVILNGESEGKTFQDIIQDGKAFDMQTFDGYIISLFEQGLITEETALAYASHRSIVSRGIDAVKSARGEKTTDIEGLSLDKDYGKRLR
ncbi:MAG: type IV pilus twitching motility protein PilT [bacterium]